MTIAGVARSLMYGWDVEESLNGPNILTCRVASAAGTYRPALDEEIVVTEGAAVIFGGYVQTVNEVGVDIGGVALINEINAIDYNSLPSRRYVQGSIVAGNLKAALTYFLTYLTAYGVTLDPAQANGPALPALSWDYRSLLDVLNEIATMSGYVWEIDYNKVLRAWLPGTVSAPTAVTDANSKAFGQVIVEVSRAQDNPYANSVIVRGGTEGAFVTGLASDAGEITAHGLWETAVFAPTATTQAVADALAAAYLAQHIANYKRVSYNSMTPGFHPGQTQTVTVSIRNINNIFLITDVRITGDSEGIVSRAVRAIEGSANIGGGWRDLYRQWTTGTGGTAFAVPVSGSQKHTYFLGALEDLWYPSTTWIAAGGGVQAIIDSVLMGTTSMTVYVRLRARSGSVTARLYNVSDSTVAGTSGAVTSATYVMTTFAVTLTPGSKIYELQLLAGVSGEEVNGVGYVE